MDSFDVIIVGAGPAGLRCAEVLSKSDLNVLLLEKNDKMGIKVCAGGITNKDLAILDLPDSIIEHKVSSTAVHSPKRTSKTTTKEPVVFTLSRAELGEWQYDQIKDTRIKILSNSRVSEIHDDYVIVNNSQKYTYRILVGADGVNSIVRRFLKLPTEYRLIGIQYRIPSTKEPSLEIFMNSKYFKAWYAWSFPHKDHIAVGCVADPKLMPTKDVKENFNKWLEMKGYDISNAKYESWPISYDYRGFKFTNVYLVGEAAGLASGFTGEGIYQALTSGDTVARTILNKDYESDEMNAVLKYNRIQNNIMKFLFKIGPLRGFFHELIVKALNNAYIKKKINAGFS